MFSMRVHAATLAAVVLLTGAGVAVAAPTVSRFDDGSFEYPKAPANSFTTIPAGQTIGPWSVTSGSVDLIGAGFWQAAEGDQSVDLNGTDTGSVAQTFATVPGATYTVTYSLAGNPGGGPTVKTGKVLVDGQDFQDFSFDVTGKTLTDMGYVTRQFTFVATAASTTVTFASTIPSAWGPALDNVQIQRCPPCPPCSAG